MIKSKLSDKELLGLTDSVEKYLQNYFRRKKDTTIRAIVNCPPDLNTLLQLQQQLKAILALEQEVLIDRIRATSDKGK